MLVSAVQHSKSISCMINVYPSLLNLPIPLPWVITEPWTEVFKGDCRCKLHGTWWLGRVLFRPSHADLLPFAGSSDSLLVPSAPPARGGQRALRERLTTPTLAWLPGAPLTPGIPSLSVAFTGTAGHCQLAGLSHGEHPSNMECPPVLRVQLPNEVRSRPWAQDCPFKAYDLGLPWWSNG